MSDIRPTRYKGVWSAGYREAMLAAGSTLRDFVAAGGTFSADAPGAWERNTLALRLGDWIAVPDDQALVVGMDALLRRRRERK